MKKIGIHEIARIAKVSTGTVDRALNGRDRISEITRKRILEIAKEFGYKPNLAARTLSTGRAAIRIAVCIPREIHYYFDQLRDGIMAEARRFESFGVEVVYHPTERLGEREAERVAEVINNKTRALILTPGDPQRLTPIIDEAEKKNIRVICVDTDASASLRSTVVGVNAEISGRLAAELMGRFLNPGSQVAVITGMLQTEDHRRKTEAFCDSYPRFCEGGQIIEVVEAHEDEKEANRKCSILLKTHRSLTGVYVNTANCLPVCRAVRTLGLSGKMRLITTDLFPRMVPFFEEGTIFASIHGRPYLQGQISMRLAVDHLVYGHPLPSDHFLAPEIVMGSTLNLFNEIRDHRPAATSHMASLMPDILQ